MQDCSGELALDVLDKYRKIFTHSPLSLNTLSLCVMDNSVLEVVILFVLCHDITLPGKRLIHASVCVKPLHLPDTHTHRCMYSCAVH